MVRLLLALALVGTLFGQAPRKKSAAKKSAPAAVEAPTRFPIETLRVTGSKLYPEPAIVKILGVKVGDLLDEKALDLAQQNLSAHGAFSGIAYKYEPSSSGKGYAVTFEVTDTEQVLPMRFDERLKFDEKAVRQKLDTLDPLFRDKIPGTQAVIERYRAAVEQAGGLPVQAKVSADGPNELYILFYPKGAPPVIAGTFFKGNSAVATADLQNTLNGVAVGVEYREKGFRELLENSLRPLYEARGRIGVKFLAVETVADPNVKGLRVTTTIEEGPSYSFGDVGVTGTGGFDRELAKAAGIRSGDVANMLSAQAAQEKIHLAMKRNGHMNVSSKVSRQVVEEKRIVNLLFTVAPGPKYTFGKLFLKGLDIHGEHEVRRLWNMKPGQPFNAEYPDYFLNRIREDGLFDNLETTRSEIKPDHQNLTADVTLIFNEKRRELLKPKQ